MEPKPAHAESFTVMKYCVDDASYLATIVNQVSCSITPLQTWSIENLDPSKTCKPKSFDTELFDHNLVRRILLVDPPAPFPRSMSLSPLTAGPVKRTTTTIVKPPLDAIFNVRSPASR